MVSRLEFDMSSLLYIANLLHPHSFATDPKLISDSKTLNFVSWMMK